MGAFRNCFSVLLIVLFAAACTSARTVSQNENTVTVVGATSCLDCAQKNINTEHAIKGLQVAIKCKTDKGDYAIKSISELDSNGGFTVQLPIDNPKGRCIAQLHGAKNKPCPDHSKIVFKSGENGKPVFGSAGQLSFSPATCASALFWKHQSYKYFYDKPWKNFFHHHIYKPPVETPPAYKLPTYKKPFPPIFYHKPLPPFPPTYEEKIPLIPKFPPTIYKKPFPSFSPVYDKPFFKKRYYKFPPVHDHPFFKTPYYKHSHPTPPVNSP